MRITLSEEQCKKVLEEIIDEILKEHIRKEMSKNIRSATYKKVDAAEKATKTRVEKAKSKIQSAINFLRFEKTKITKSSLASTAGVSRGTVNKHWKDIEETIKDINSFNKRIEE